MIRDACVLHIFNLVPLFITALHCCTREYFNLHARSTHTIGSILVSFFVLVSLRCNSSNVLKRRRHMVNSCIEIHLRHNTRYKKPRYKLFIFLPFWHIHDFRGKTGSLIIINCEHGQQIEMLFRCSIRWPIDSDVECVPVIFYSEYSWNWKFSHFESLWGICTFCVFILSFCFDYGIRLVILHLRFVTSNDPAILS